MALPVVIECSGEQHTMWIEHGKEPWCDSDEDAHDVELELGLGEMGAELPACVRFIQTWHDKGIVGLMFGEWNDEVFAAFNTPQSVADYLADERPENQLDIIKDVMANALAEAIKTESDEAAVNIAEYLKSLLNVAKDVRLDSSSYESDDSDGTLTYHVTWTLSIDLVEVAQWRKNYERRTYDFFYFTSDEVSDWCEDVDSEFCTPEVVTAVLEVFGLSDELDDDDVPEPYKPAEPCEDVDDCDYGVLFVPADTSKGSFHDEFYRPVVVPYSDFQNAEWGMEHSLGLLRRDGEDESWDLTVVRRISGDAFNRLVRRLETERATYPLFSHEIMGPNLSDQDLMLLQWQPWTKKDEDEL